MSARLVRTLLMQQRQAIQRAARNVEDISDREMLGDVARILEELYDMHARWGKLIWEPAEQVFGEMINRHTKAIRDDNEERQKKLFRMISDFATEWPEEAKHWQERWAGGEPEGQPSEH